MQKFKKFMRFQRTVCWQFLKIENHARLIKNCFLIFYARKQITQMQLRGMNRFAENDYGIFVIIYGIYKKTTLPCDFSTFSPLETQ